MGIYIGIDLGTTALKVAVYDARTGIRRAGRETALRIAMGRNGRREQQPGDVFKALISLIRGLLKTAADRKAVLGIGLAAQGGSGIVADRRTGRALTPMVLWNDARAFDRFHEIAARHTPRYWRARTLREEPGMGLARLSLLREQSRSLVSDSNVYVGAGDFLYFHLTGAWRQDACHAQQTGCYDTRTDSLSPSLATLAGVSTAFFPPLRNGHETHPLVDTTARQLGLAAGIPVAGPYMDHEAGYLSSAHVSSRPLQCSLGTAWVGNFQLPAAFRGESAIQFAIPAPAGAGRLVIMPLLTGNVTWDWALAQFVDPDPVRALRAQKRVLDRALLPPEGLIAFPWLNRPHPLRPDCLGGCSFVGVGPSTTREDLLRAVVAGMGYELHRVFADVADQGAVDALVLSGGTSNSPHFRTLITALFDPLPVYQLDDAAWMGTRGCLWAFGETVARAAARPVNGATDLDRNSLAAGRKLYEEVYARLYRHERAGIAYRVRPAGEGS